MRKGYPHSQAFDRRCVVEEIHREYSQIVFVEKSDGIDNGTTAEAAEGSGTTSDGESMGSYGRGMSDTIGHLASMSEVDHCR